MGAENEFLAVAQVSFYSSTTLLYPNQMNLKMDVNFFY
jgi:hypothetical protein